MLDFTKAITAIEHAKNILILPSSPVDGDSLGSALGLYDVLKGMGKSATVVLTSEIPDIYNFLPNISHIHSSAEMYSEFMITLHLKDQMLEDIRHEIIDDHVNIIVTPTQGRFSQEQVSFPEPKKHYDLIITVDCADLTQLGEFYRQHFQIFSEVPSINIDHHISNKNYASLNLVDASYCSTTHILYDLLLEMSAEINPDVATLLLAGIITDTGSFQNTNTTPEAFDVAAELIDLGGRQQEIIQHIYKTKQLNSLKLWGKILSKIQIDNEYQLMWTTLTNIDLKETETTNQDKGEIMDELLSNAEDARIVILLEERPGNILHGSIRVNNDEINAVTIAENFGGGGHQRAAGFNIENATVESHESKILKFVRQYLDQVYPENSAETDNYNATQPQSDLETQDSGIDLQPVAVPVPVDAAAPVAVPVPEQILESQDNVSPAESQPSIEDDFADMPLAPVAPTQAPESQPTSESQPEPTQIATPQPSVSELDMEFNAMPQAPADPVAPAQAPQVNLSESQQLDNYRDEFEQEEELEDDQSESDPFEDELFDNSSEIDDSANNNDLTPINTPEDELEQEPEYDTPEMQSEEEEPEYDDTDIESEEEPEYDTPEMQSEEEEPEYDDTDIESELLPSSGEFGSDDMLDDQTPDQDMNIDEDIPVDPLAQASQDNQETEDRIKDLSQKFFTEQPEQAQPAQPKASQDQSAASPFSEIPSFGENLDLSQVPEQSPKDDDMEFPPNPFGTPTQPGQVPNPDVPEDL